MAGLTSTGLSIKRLPEIITDLQKTATTVFADLAPSGDVVDTSDITALGRLIGLVAPSHASIWEALQEIHNSFSAQNATGIALDNIVALSGIARYPAANSRAHCLLTGDTNTALTLAAKVSSSTTRRIFSLLSSVVLDINKACGVAITIGAVQASTTYRLSFTVDGVTVTNVSITSDATPTAEEVLAALGVAITTAHGSVFTAVVEGTLLWVKRVDPFQPVTFSASANIIFSKAQKIAVFECDVPGSIVQLAKTIDTIAVPVLGWDSIVNPVAAGEGRLIETDAELRERFRVSKYFQAVNILEAIIDAIKNVPDVVDVMVYENDTDTVDAYGVPPHAFMPIVLGGLTTSIGEAIWKNKPTGIPSVGNTLVSIADSQGLQHPISFFRPTLTRLYVKMTIQSTGVMAGDAPTLIKEALAAQILASNKIGTDVVYSRLYTPINSVSGFQINSLTLGTTANPTGTANIVIPFNAVATLAAADITITVV